MSAIPPKADIPNDDCHVRFVPKADIYSPYSITSAALARRLGGMVSPSVLQFSPMSVQPMDFLRLTVVSDLPI
jgi:hypothetical protein